MKKILTVSLFAMMAVSAANAEIASTDYVGKQLQPYSTTAEMEAYVADELGTMQGGLGDAIDTVASNLATYQTTNNAAVAAAKKAGDDAQADIDAYIESNDAALALKANSADVYTKTAADAEFMNSSEVSTAIANAVTGDNGALKDYSTTAQMNTAITNANDTQTETITNAYKAADTALETSLKSYADTAEADAIAAAKTAGDAAYDVKGAAAAAQTAAVNAAELAADAKYQVKSSALSVGAAGGEWTDLTKAAGYSETGTHSLVLKNGTIQWEAVSY